MNRLGYVLAGALCYVPVLAWALAPPAPRLDVKSYYLMDAATGSVIASKDAEVPYEPASMTKIMTAYVAGRLLKDGQISWDDQVPVSKAAYRKTGSTSYLNLNQRVSVNDLMRGLVIQSGNDASITLAEHIAGSEEGFAQFMNHYAEEVGLRSSHFVTATGLPPEDQDLKHVMSARDVAHLSRMLIYETPDVYALHKIREFTFNNVRQFNRNRLLSIDDSVDGIKTGHTESAKYCLAASAARGDMRLIAVVFGAETPASRDEAARQLLEYGFRFFDSSVIVSADDFSRSVKVLGAGDSEVFLPVGVSEDVRLLLERGQRKDVEYAIRLPTALVAPVEAGAPLGEVEVFVEGQSRFVGSLLADRSVADGGFISTLMASTSLQFRQWFDLEHEMLEKRELVP